MTIGARTVIDACSYCEALQTALNAANASIASLRKCLAKVYLEGGLSITEEPAEIISYASWINACASRTMCSNTTVAD